MMKKYEVEFAKFVTNIQNTTGSVNKGKLILEDTQPADALSMLNEIKARSLDRFKELDKNY
jgi:dynein heavy chain